MQSSGDAFAQLQQLQHSDLLGPRMQVRGPCASPQPTATPAPCIVVPPLPAPSQPHPAWLFSMLHQPHPATQGPGPHSTSHTSMGSAAHGGRPCSSVIYHFSGIKEISSLYLCKGHIQSSHVVPKILLLPHLEMSLCDVIKGSDTHFTPLILMTALPAPQSCTALHLVFVALQTRGRHNGGSCSRKPMLSIFCRGL